MENILMLLPAEINESSSYTALRHPSTGTILVETKAMLELRDDCLRAGTMAFTIEVRRHDQKTVLRANYNGSREIPAAIRQPELSDIINLSTQI